MSYPRRAVLAVTTAAVALGLMACSRGGASDEVGAAVVRQPQGGRPRRQGDGVARALPL